MLQNELTFQSEQMATIRCSNGHILLVNLTHPESLHREHFADILNGAERLPLTVFQTAKALEAKGYVETEWGNHRAYTEAPEEKLEPVAETGETTGGVPEDETTTPTQPVAEPPVPNSGSGEVPTDYEALSDDELNAVAIASGIDLDGKGRDDIILALLELDDKKGGNRQ